MMAERGVAATLMPGLRARHFFAVSLAQARIVLIEPVSAY
jgi:hypothetical protein